MHEPFFLENNTSIRPTLFMQIFHYLSFKFGALCIPLNSTNDFHSVDLTTFLLLILYLLTLEGSPECTVSEMTYYLILICTNKMIVCQNHVFLPNKMVCIFTTIYLWVSTTKSVLCPRRILLSRASDATSDSTIAANHLVLAWAILKESWMQFVFRLITKCGSVSPL